MSLKENQSKNPEFVMLSKEFLVVMQRNQNKNERTSLLDDFNATQLQKNAVSVAWGSAARLFNNHFLSSIRSENSSSSS